MASSRARRAARVVATLAALFLVAIAVVPFFVPQRVVRGLVLRTLDRGCGCTVGVRGNVAFTLWPEPGLVATRLRIEDPPGFAPRPLLRVRRITLRASWGELFAGRWALASVRLRGTVLALRRNARGESNLGAFFHPGTPSPRPSPRSPSGATPLAASLRVFGRLVVHDFEIVGKPGGRLLADVRRLSLGPLSRTGLPLSLNVRVPSGKKGVVVGSLRGTLVVKGTSGIVLDLAALGLRDPSVFPGPLSAGAARIEFLPETAGTRWRVSSLALTDPRLGRASLHGDVILAGAKVAHAVGALRLRLLPGVVRHAAPWLRPRPGRSGLLVTARFSGGAGRFGASPFALSWSGHRGPAQLGGTLAGAREAQGWCWRLHTKGAGLGLRLPKADPAPATPLRAAVPPRAARARVAPGPPPAAPDPPRPCLRLRADLANFDLEGVPVPRLRLQASLEGSRLRVPRLDALVFGGTLQGNARGRLVGGRPRDLTTRLSFHGIELVRALPALDPGGGTNLTGRLGGGAVLATHGGLRRRAWSGSGRVAGTGLVWRGIDLAAIVRSLGAVIHGRIPSRWPSGGATPFGTLHASWRLASDRVVLQHLVLGSSLLRVTGAGHVDLAGVGRLDLGLDLAPGPGAGARGWPSALRGIDVPVHVGGSLAHPLPIPDVPAVLHRLLRRRLGTLLGGFLRRG